MALKQKYLGQNVGYFRPDVAITHDPSVDIPVLIAAGYIGGRLMAVKMSGTSGRGPVLIPADGIDNPYPVGVLINGPGNLNESIGVSGSGKLAVVRSMPDFDLVNDTAGTAYVASPTLAYAEGLPLYCDTVTDGLWTSDIPASGAKVVQGVCTHAPTTAEPWLGVASLV